MVPLAVGVQGAGHGAPAKRSVVHRVVGRVSREQELLAASIKFADTIVADYDVVEFLHRLAERCVELIGASEAGVMPADRDGTLHLNRRPDLAGPDRSRSAAGIGRTADRAANEGRRFPRLVARSFRGCAHIGTCLRTVEVDGASRPAGPVGRERAVIE